MIQLLEMVTVISLTQDSCQMLAARETSRIFLLTNNNGKTSTLVFLTQCWNWYFRYLEAQEPNYNYNYIFSQLMLSMIRKQWLKENVSLEFIKLTTKNAMYKNRNQQKM